MCLLVVFTLFLFVGCITSPVTYSFAAAGEQNFASITFKSSIKEGEPSLTFVSYNGQSLPKPEKKTHWEPINFPSGTELRIIVRAKYRTTSRTTLSGFGVVGELYNVSQEIRAVSRNVDADIIFICPPLEAGKNYLLAFSKEPGMPGKNILTLTDVAAARVVIQQEFEVTFGGDFSR